MLNKTVIVTWLCNEATSLISELMQVVCAHPHKDLHAIVKHGVQHEDVSVERKVTLAYQFAKPSCRSH